MTETESEWNIREVYYSNLTNEALDARLNVNRREQRANLTKLVGIGFGVPFLGLSTLVGAVKLTTPFENNHLNYLISMGLALVAGGYAGASGMIEGYAEEVKRLSTVLKYGHITRKHLKEEKKKRRK